MSIPAFDSHGNLPSGVHYATWAEFVDRYSFTHRRMALMAGLHDALVRLAEAGCGLAYVDGSFVTSKPEPGDFDALWSREGVDPDRLDRVFLTFDRGRAAQKARFGGELFPAEIPEGRSGRTFLEFFQTDRERGTPKGIAALRLDMEGLLAYPPDIWAKLEHNR